MATESASSPRPGLRLAAAVGGSGADAVALAGGFAYVGMGPRLVVVDVSDPTAPVTAAELRLQSEPRALAVDRSLAAIVGYDGATALVTVNDPRRPARLAALPSPQRAYDVALAAGQAYVAQGSLATWDLSDPRQPRLIGATSDGCALTALTVSGQLVVAAGKRDSYTACLTVWDAADPGHPRALKGLEPATEHR